MATRSILVGFVLTLALAVAFAKPSITELPPGWDSANFFFSGKSSLYLGSVMLTGSFQFLNTTTGSSWTAQQHSSTAMSVEGSIELDNSYLTIDQNGMVEYTIDETGCFVDKTLNADTVFPTCSTWFQNVNGDGISGTWRQYCSSQLSMGYAYKTSTFAYNGDEFTTITTNETFSPSGNESSTSTVTTLQVTTWLTEAPLPSAFDHSTTDCQEEPVDIFAEAEGIVQPTTGSALSEKKRISFCGVCKTATEITLNGVFNTFACKYKAVPLALCSKTPFSSICKAVINTACKICTQIGKGKCSWSSLAFSICKKMGKC